MWIEINYIPPVMKSTSMVDRLLKNMGNMHEHWGVSVPLNWAIHFMHNSKKMADIGEKKCLSGEKYLVTIEVIMDDYDMPVEVKDTVIKRT